jgi:hypothetical protein
MDTMTLVAVLGTIISFIVGRLLKLTALGASLLATLFLIVWTCV